MMSGFLPLVSSRATIKIIFRVNLLARWERLMGYEFYSVGKNSKMKVNICVSEVNLDTVRMMLENKPNMQV